jgi:hypothetical protein
MRFVMQRNTKQVEKIAKEFGFSITLIRQRNHLCFQLKRKNAIRLLVTAKSPSDFRALRNVRTQIKKIAQSLQGTTISNGILLN